ncbi:hypothetical protein [Pontibacter sp. G13]|uniref:hypothetical protein n=1 Tax=Pontibacter sp. G13 TaxID=3074898 RepID=UPI00288A6253|nr:hypothetical protein [Pontibacter sp. G13]WNJ19647.1 hypothetical protein RJD25_04105 [Pontibacter sp. G13]
MNTYRTLSLAGLKMVLVLLFGLTTQLAQAQRLSLESKIELVLSDNLNITLFKTMTGQTYYYLPDPQLIKLGLKESGVPEFLFLKFTTDERESDGGVQGALLHFLIEWGMTPAQFAELEAKLKAAKGQGAKLAGPVDLKPVDGSSFHIVSAVLGDDDFTSNLVTSGYAPPMPGGKAAVAARLDAAGAQLLDATFKETTSITDLSLVLDYEYTTLVKAARGVLRYNLSITQTQGDAMAYDFLKKELDNEPERFQAALDTYNANKASMSNDCGLAGGMGNMILAMQAMDQAIGNTSGSGDTGSNWEYGVSESMLRRVYDYFVQTERIVLKWEETLDDERLAVMREAFFDFFLNSFTEPDMPDFSNVADLGTDFDPEAANMKSQAEASYSFKSCTELESNRTVNKVVRLDKIILPVTRRFQMVSNLASTYDQAKDYDECVTEQRLDDPFFQHRDINFIVDLEARELFDTEVNYVTVDVLKKRSTGRDFNKDFTIDGDDLRRSGALKMVTYSRDDDRNTDSYQYKVQWSFKGGYVYPERPRFVKGDWQGVTLFAPLSPRKIEFEADLEEMRELGVVRATLQVRYSKFGKEHEENIPITVSKNEPLVEKTIFVDRETNGYAYRLILTHKVHGKLALDWQTKLNDDYVYAIIPSELLEEDPNYIEQLIEIGRQIISPNSDGTVDPDDAILQTFGDILDLVIDNQ